jgi:uncharacterized protein
MRATRSPEISLSTDLSKPLSPEEVVELDEMLAADTQDRETLDVVMLDGFLAGVLLQPETVLPTVWLPLVFAAEASALPPDGVQLSAAIDLIMRRYNEIAACIVAREPFNPILFEAVDEHGNPLRGKAGIKALLPWAAGFATAYDAFPALAQMVDTDDDLAASVTGILRHLSPGPEATDEEREEHAREAAELDRESPLADLDDAIDGVIASVLDIADVTRPNRPIQRATPKVGRNDPCPCGSGRKYKQCHGREAS